MKFWWMLDVASDSFGDCFFRKHLITKFEFPDVVKFIMIAEFLEILV